MGRNREVSLGDEGQLRKYIRDIIIITSGTFMLAVLVSLASEFLLRSITSLFLSFLILLAIVLVGIAFDIIGVAVAVAQEPPFHAKAAEKVRGASQAVYLVRRADRVASFCNDVVGDICGTISGALGAVIALRFLLTQLNWSELIATVIMTSLVAALTVGGKALGKTFAINQANDIVFMVGRILAWLENICEWSEFYKKKRVKKRRSGEEN